MSTFTPRELAYLRRRYPGAPGCAECGHPMRPTEPDQTSHPLCDPAVANIVRRAA